MGFHQNIAVAVFKRADPSRKTQEAFRSGRPNDGVSSPTSLCLDLGRAHFGGSAQVKPCRSSGANRNTSPAVSLLNQGRLVESPCLYESRAANV